MGVPLLLHAVTPVGGRKAFAVAVPALVVLTPQVRVIATLLFRVLRLPLSAGGQPGRVLGAPVWQLVRHDQFVAPMPAVLLVFVVVAGAGVLV